MIKWSKAEENILKIACKGVETITEVKNRYNQLVDGTDFTKRTWDSVKNKMVRMEIRPTLLMGELETQKVIKVDLKKFKGKLNKLLIVSDSHLCSKYQQLTYLTEVYHYAKEQGIKTVLHAGDVSAGHPRMHRGYVYETLFKYGYDEQLEYIVDKYPKINGMTTYMIGGSHDWIWYKVGGVDIIKAIAKERKDIIYMGYAGAEVIIPDLDLNIYIHHPTGGVPYARSYRMQKTIEQFAPQNKPDILIQGHLHINNFLPMYRNVVGFAIGCFEAQTPFLKSKGLYPEISALLVEITTNDYFRENGIASVKYEFLPFFVPKENDY